MAAAPQDRLEKRRRNRLRALIAATESEGARLQFWARTASLSAIAVVFAAISEWNAALAYVLAALFVFFLSGLINYWLARTGGRPSWFVRRDGDDRHRAADHPCRHAQPVRRLQPASAMGLREGGFKYLLIIVCLGALSLSPRLALWLGIAAAICWSLARRLGRRAAGRRHRARRRAAILVRRAAAALSRSELRRSGRADDAMSSSS